MLSVTGFWRQVAVTLALVPAVTAFKSVPASAEDGFPFGFEMTLETAPQPGSKRVPTLEIGDNGEARLDLWCKAGKGQFSVAGNTVIFVPGPLQDHDCPPARAQADDELVAAGRSGVVYRNQAATLSNQHQLKFPASGALVLTRAVIRIATGVCSKSR